jgi:hypothetical protein
VQLNTEWALSKSSFPDSIGNPHSNFDINGGAIDGTPIGAAAKSTGAFTTLSADSSTVVSLGTPWDMTDGQYNGKTVVGQAGETLAFGDLIRQHTDGKYYKTDADSLITMDRYCRLSCAAIAADAYGVMLVEGYICESDWSFATVGGALFASATTGAMTQTAPSGDEDLVQTVGKLENADIVYFDPEHSWVKVGVP